MFHFCSGSPAGIFSRSLHTNIKEALSLDFRSYMNDNIVFFDGGIGSILQKKDLLPPGEYSENLYFTNPDALLDIHRGYYDAGCNVVSTCTFRANALNFPEEKVSEIIRTAVHYVKRALMESTGRQEKFIALETGPLGKLLRPYGDLAFEDAVAMYAQIVRVGADCGVDLFSIETMNDCLESKAALLAVKENSDLPVLVSNTYGEDGKLMTGASPAAMAAMLEGMGVDMIGANCALGPKQMAPVIDELLRCASVPVFMKPNAGLPRSVNGHPVYSVTPEEYADEVIRQIKAGVRMAGGCCGTDPDYLKLMISKAVNLKPVPLVKKDSTVISSYTKAIEIGYEPLLIGERINPTGSKKIRQALRSADINVVVNEGLSQEEQGAAVIDVNVGLPDINEPAVLKEIIPELQSVSSLPLQIDTADPAAMEAALRCYNGKPLINSVSGKAESMAAVFPLAKKYGGVIVALTLDENGIPGTAEGRLAIAEKILRSASEYGIDKKDILFDPLAMTVSTNSSAALTVLDTLRLIKEKTGCKTSLGISNISYGLPDRDAVNAAFFAVALTTGLDAAIINPGSYEIMKSYYAYRVIKGLDFLCSDYMAFCSGHRPAEKTAALQNMSEASLGRAIIRGLKDQAGLLAEAALKAGTDPLILVREEIIPALDAVGQGYEERTVFLPQLLMSADAAGCAFEAVKRKISGKGTPHTECTFVLATVRGDLHDIGKNIVRLLLENYGFNVIDLGIDVPPEKILAAVKEHRAPLTGLSALMTTSIPAMEETILLLRREAPWCRIVVGGAVMNQECANEIGADHYAKDAMETVRYAERIIRLNTPD